MGALEWLQDYCAGQSEGALNVLAEIERRGFVIVPKEPTAAMLEAGGRVYPGEDVLVGTGVAGQVWTAMLSERLKLS